VQENKPDSKRRWPLFAVIAMCAAPMIASYITYYFIKPEGRTNYGELIDPRQYPIPAQLGTRSLDGKPLSLDTYRGKWIMLHADASDCDEACQKKMWNMRQLRLTQGKNMDRVERVWLILDANPIETMLIREYDGTHLLRVDPAALRAWLPVESSGVVTDHIYMIDPLGNLMMRFPKNADPNRVKRDLSKLLKASRIG
jgi:hypothetical protein